MTILALLTQGFGEASKEDKGDNRTGKIALFQSISKRPNRAPGKGKEFMLLVINSFEKMVRISTEQPAQAHHASVESSIFPTAMHNLYHLVCKKSAMTDPALI